MSAEMPRSTKILCVQVDDVFSVSPDVQFPGPGGTIPMPGFRGKRVWGSGSALSVAFARTRTFSGSDSPFTPPLTAHHLEESASARFAGGRIEECRTSSGLHHRVIAMVRR